MKRTTLRKDVPQDLIENIRKLAGDGYGTHLIGDILGVSDKTVRSRAQQHSIALPARSSHELCNWWVPPRESIERAAAARVRWVEWSGGRERLLDAAERLGISASGLSNRIKRWGVEKAMSLPRQSRGPVKPRKVSAGHPWVTEKKKAA